jgi:hypothetical protein
VGRCRREQLQSDRTNTKLLDGFHWQSGVKLVAQVRAHMSQSVRSKTLYVASIVLRLAIHESRQDEFTPP